MHDVLEQVDIFLNEPVKEDNKQELFDRVANFILQLEPDSLSDDQLDEVVDILDQLEFDDELEEQLDRPLKLAKRSSIKKRQRSRQYTRSNRGKIKRKRVQFKRSTEGRKRKLLKKRMELRFKTPTGQKKKRYHTTRGGQGGVRKKQENKNENT